MDEILKFIGTGFGKFIVAGGAIGVAALKHIITKWKLTLKFNANKLKRDFANEAHIQIEDFIKSIQAVSQGNRVNIWRYSNGTKDYGGICFEKVSCTNEKTDGNTSGIKHVFQDVPLNDNMRRTIQRIGDCNEDYLLIDSDSELYDDGIILEMYGSRCSYHFKIFKKNVWQGVVSITFRDKNEISAEDIHRILIYMANIKRLHEKMIN